MPKIVCTSDLHENLPVVPECDLLLIAGDLTYAFKGDHKAQHDFLAGPFRVWLEEIPAEEVIVVAGNHDECVQLMGFPQGLRCIYLEDDGVQRFGKKIWGTPWQPWFYDWAYNAPQHEGEVFLNEKFSQIPDDTDIIICHGPPYGYGDSLGQFADGNQPHVGSTALAQHCARVEPELVVCGHIHVGYGMYRTPWGGDVINAALVDNRYQPVNPLVEVEL